MSESSESLDFTEDEQVYRPIQNLDHVLGLELLPEEYDHIASNRLNTLECTIKWDNIGYSVPVNAGIVKQFLSRHFKTVPIESKSILNGISGFALPGKFLAIMGASGSGKTTLLNILSNRFTTGKVSGEYTVNGDSIPANAGRYRKLVGYVLQHDILLPFLTVRETLFFSAMLTLPRSLPMKKKMARVNGLIEELGLVKCADQIVGNQLVRGISGGEKKRLAIGIELLQDPAVLFLDEPTSGLDSKTALGLIEHLSKLAHKYRHTIVTTIHQPRSAIFNQFDYLLLLAPGGQQLYFGPTQNSVEYFSALGYPCPQFENPADHLVDCTVINPSSPEAKQESMERIQGLVGEWKSRSDHEPDVDLCTDGIQEVRRAKIAPWWYQVFWLSQREGLNDFRNIPLLITRFFQVLVISLTLGFVFFDLGNDQTTITDRNGLLFFILITMGLVEVVAGLIVFLQGSAVFYRERDSGSYKVSAYWAAKQIGLLPFQLIYPFIYIIVVYWLAGLQSDWYKFFIFFGTLELTANCATSYGLLYGASLPPPIASMLGPLTNVMCMIFAGFLISFETMTPVLRWISYLSYGTYAFDSLIQNEYTDLTLTCEPDQTLSDGTCPYTRGREVISSLHLNEFDYYQDMLVILAFIVTLRILLYLVLRFRKPH